MSENPLFESIMSLRSKPRHVFECVKWRVLTEIAVETILVFYIFALGGDGGYALVLAFFPAILLLVDSSLQIHPIVLYVLAILQFPFYGVIIGLADWVGERCRLWTACGLVLLHFVAIGAFFVSAGRI